MKNEILMPPFLPGLGKLKNREGVLYLDFRRNLSTNYNFVRLSIIFNWVSILFMVVISYFLRNTILVWFVLIPLSLLQHRILTTLHEGAHFHLDKNRHRNDFFTNLLSGWFTLNSIQVYRKIHLEHHRFLGEKEDPESTYMEKLDLTWLLSALFGIKTIAAFFSEKFFIPRRNISSKIRAHNYMFMIGLVAHASIILFLITLNLKTALVWCFSTFLLLPFLSLLRNILEHRYVECVNPELIDFLYSNNTPIEINPTNSATTRTFTVSRLSSLYGSMGFSRHLIHHWDPSISFQNLHKVQAFLLETQIGSYISTIDTTYTRTFIRLWRKNVY